MALLRSLGGLWLLGVNYMALCDNRMAQIRWGGICSAFLRQFYGPL